MNLTHCLNRAVCIRADGLATVDGATRRTWRETDERVRRAAGGLCARGLSAGDRVAVLAPNGARYFEAFFAVPWAGGVIVPINMRLSPAEIAYILADSGAMVFLVDSALRDQLDSILSKAPAMRHVIALGEGWDGMIAASAPAEDAMRGGDDLAGIFYTGGTTGSAKGVMLSHANLAVNALDVTIALGYTRDTAYLHTPPMFHLADGCSTFGVTALGGTHVFLPRFDPETFLPILNREAVTNVTLVPTMINLLINHPRFSPDLFRTMKTIFYGAAPMPDGVLRKALTALPKVKFQQAWGMTELSPIATILDARYSVLDGPLAGRLRSCGQPVTSAEIRIVDGLDGEVPPRTVGEIVVRGPTVMQGYWNKPEETARALREGWLHSGDAGYMDEEGFVFVVDRLKDMIVTGGENVYSAEVEGAISLMPGVREVAVIGIPHEVWGETIHAVIVPQVGFELSSDDVVAHCREHLGAYKVPRSFDIRPEPLPVSAAGKILKRNLREPFWKDKDRNVG